MQFGPDQIIACPICKGLAKHMTLHSGNTFGALVWTDGNRMAPGLPRPPAVVKCGNCGNYYWLHQAERVNDIYDCSDRLGADQPYDPAWASAKEVQEPGEEEYYEALGTNLAEDPEQEKTLRILTWWRSNDAIRYSSTDGESIGRNEVLRRNNLEALAELLNEKSDHDRLMKAEVLRELGEFESAKQVLASVESPELAAVVRQMRSLCDQEDRLVRILRF